MSTRELIHAEIENVPDEDLDRLYEIVRHFAEATADQRCRPGALARLKQIKIDAPEDFAANLDLYLTGEKQLATDEDVR